MRDAERATKPLEFAAPATAQEIASLAGAENAKMHFVCFLCPFCHNKYCNNVDRGKAVRQYVANVCGHRILIFRCWALFALFFKQIESVLT